MFNEQYASIYFRTISQVPSASCKERKKSVNYLLEYLDRENLDLTDGIEAKDLIKFIEYLSNGEHRVSGGKGKKKLSPKTVHQVISLLKSFFNFCFVNKLLTIHPDLLFNDELRRNLPKVRSKPKAKLADVENIGKSIRETHRLLDKANDSKKALLWTIYNSMTSVSIVLEARLDDLDLERKRLLLRDRKSNIIREVILYGRTVEVLKEYLNLHRPLSDSGYIFLSRFKEKITDRTVQRYLKSHSLKVLGKPLTPGDLKRLGILHVQNTRASMDKIVTLRTMTEKTLKASDLKFQKLIEAMIDGLLVIATDGTITYANQALCNMLDYEPGEILGLSIDKLSFGESIEMMLKRPESLTGVRVAPHEQYLTTKQGQSILTVVSPSILYSDAEEGEEHAVGILAVITNLAA
ncbi:MAG: PAS domain-containing protein [Candidatus Odinarchaeota archaeon]